MQTKIKQPDDIEKIMAKAEKFCAYSERSRNDVKRKLILWQVPEELHEKIISTLYAENFLSDDRFITLFIRSKINQNKWGKNKIKAALFQHGYPEEQIEKHFSDKDYEQINRNLDMLIQKKLENNHDKNDVQLHEKLKQFLYNKGYEAEMIAQKFQYK
jgi:regulatory protein